MARTSDFSNIGSVTRSSKKTDVGGWDFVSGSTVGTLTEYATNTAAIYQTVGLLMEPDSTVNEIRNPRGEGAVAGTPGTAPTNWTVQMGGVTTSIVGSGTTDGWPYVDVRFNGTPTGNGFIFFEGASQIAAANGQTWTVSGNVSLAAGSLTNISSTSFGAWFYSSTPAFLGGSTVTTDTPNTSNNRFFNAFTVDQASAAYIRPYFFIDWAGAGAIDVTFRVYGPQCEQKAQPTSLIMPPSGTPAATTRAADTITVAAGAWKPATAIGALSVYLKAQVGAGTAGDYLSIGADNNERVSLGFDGSSPYVDVYDGGGTQVVDHTSATTYSVGDTLEFAFSLAQNDYHGAISADTSDDTACTYSIDTFTVTLGDAPGGSVAAEVVWIQDFRFWPRQLSDAEINALGGA